MKTAKVSSVYEGTGRRRYMGGREGAISSKNARMLARARAKILRARKALARTMNAKSMPTKPLAKKEDMPISISTKPMVMEDMSRSMSMSMSMSMSTKPLVKKEDMPMSISTKPMVMEGMSMSMWTKPMEIKKVDEVKLVIDVDALEAKEEAKSNDNFNVETNNDKKTAEEEEVQQQQQQLQPAVVNYEEKKNGDDGMALLTMADWPMTWTYEEEQIWFRKAYEYGWHPTPEPLSTDLYLPRIDPTNETVWNYDDMSTWTIFQDNNGTAPNP